MFWGEYPLKPADIAALPAYLIRMERFTARNSIRLSASMASAR